MISDAIDFLDKLLSGVVENHNTRLHAIGVIMISSVVIIWALFMTMIHGK